MAPSGVRAELVSQRPVSRVRDCRGRSPSTPTVSRYPFRGDQIPLKRSVWLQIALALGSAAAIIVAVSASRPYVVPQEPVAVALVEHRYVDSLEVSRAPWLHAPVEVALKTPQFLLDRELFAMDLLRTGKVTQTRARALADVAVREAYTRQVPPALVLGVMLTENDELKSSARSNVGAVGLMQVVPKPGTSLGRKFGTNVHTDSTNLKYGIFILGWVAEKAAKLVVDQDDAWRNALLRYNGCVSGTFTRDCHRYPDVVRRQVQQSAKIDRAAADDFKHCVAEPMWASPPRFRMPTSHGRRARRVDEHGLGAMRGSTTAALADGERHPQNIRRRRRARRRHRSTCRTRRLVALVGESGSGKTTLLRCFNRLVEPDSGDDSHRRRRRVDASTPSCFGGSIGYVPQDGGLLPHWRVQRNVELVLRLRGEPNARDRARATRSRSSGSTRRVSPIDGRASCPAVSASVSRSRARWPRSQRCCCSTSRSARSTRSRAPSSRTRSPRCASGIDDDHACS